MWVTKRGGKHWSKTSEGGGGLPRVERGGSGLATDGCPSTNQHAGWEIPTASTGGASVRGRADKRGAAALVKKDAQLEIRITRSGGNRAVREPHTYAVGGREARTLRSRGSRAEGEDEMGNEIAGRMAPISEIGLIRANRSVGTTFARSRRVSGPGESSNGQGEGDFLTGNPPRMRIRGFGARGCS